MCENASDLAHGFLADTFAWVSLGRPWPDPTRVGQSSAMGLVLVLSDSWRDARASHIKASDGLARSRASDGGKEAVNHEENADSRCVYRGSHV